MTATYHSTKKTFLEAGFAVGEDVLVGICERIDPYLATIPAKSDRAETAWLDEPGEERFSFLRGHFTLT